MGACDYEAEGYGHFVSVRSGSAWEGGVREEEYSASWLCFAPCEHALHRLKDAQYHVVPEIRPTSRGRVGVLVWISARV